MLMFLKKVNVSKVKRATFIFKYIIRVPSVFAQLLKHNTEKYFIFEQMCAKS